MRVECIDGIDSVGSTSAGRNMLMNWAVKLVNSLTYELFLMLTNTFLIVYVVPVPCVTASGLAAKIIRQLSSDSKSAVKGKKLIYLF